MTEYLNKVLSDTEPWKMIPDSEENIIRDLEAHTLDPVFELYGNFVNPAPEWLDEKVAAKYAGCASIFGNFLDWSHAFRLVTDDEALISRITEAVEKNKVRPEYQAAREKMIASLPTLTVKNAKVGNHYAFAGSWIKLTRVYRIPNDEANKKMLLYLDRFDGITPDGDPISAALPGSEKLRTSENWKV